MNHNLDAACARALGQEPQMRYCERAHEMAEWHEVQYFIETDEAYAPNTASQRIADAMQRGAGMLRPCVPRGDTGLWRVVPAYSEDCAAARELEDEIERRGLWSDYVSALIDLVRPDSGGKLVWAIIRATPAQRARAFVASYCGACHPCHVEPPR